MSGGVGHKSAVEISVGLSLPGDALSVHLEQDRNRSPQPSTVP